MFFREPAKRMLSRLVMKKGLSCLLGFCNLNLLCMCFQPLYCVVMTWTLEIVPG